MNADVLSIDQVAELLDCSTQTVSERTTVGDLPGIKFGRSWRYPREALIKRLNELALQPANKTPEPPVAVAVRPAGRRAPPVLPVL